MRAYIITESFKKVNRTNTLFSNNGFINNQDETKLRSATAFAQRNARHAPSVRVCVSAVLTAVQSRLPTALDLFTYLHYNDKRIPDINTIIYSLFTSDGKHRIPGLEYPILYPYGSLRETDRLHQKNSTFYVECGVFCVTAYLGSLVTHGK